MTIGGALSGRNNALNLIRFLLAAAVIYSHTYPLGGYGREPNVANTTVGTMAVGAFFALSGYLIAGSRMRLGFRPYVWHRCIRILPAFWVCLIVVAFGFAPLAALGSGERWDLGSGLTYVTANFTLHINQAGVGGTLASSPVAVDWNGSMWTLFYEFVAYLGAGFLLSSPIIRRHVGLTVGCALVLMTLLQRVARGTLGITDDFFLHFLWLGCFFLAGMFLWAVSDRLPASPWLAGLSAAALIPIAMFGYFTLLGPLLLAYLLLWVGGAVSTRVLAANDVSYGLYIYAFPVQQSLVLANAHTVMPPAAFALLSLVLTIPVAFASWKLIEKPSLRLKNFTILHARRRGVAVIP